MNIIDMRNVSLVLGEESILKNVSLKILQGETLVIIGPSGGGKTVLLKTMVGLYPPTSGEVICMGEDWQKISSQKKRKQAEKIGVQFQKTALFDSYTAGENIAFPLREHFPDMSDQIIKERIEYCLDSVNLGGAQDKYPHELSGGMRQRLAVARALAMKPEVVFYDDPTAGLDPINSDKMMDLLLNLQTKQKTTMIVITNDILRAYQLAGRIILVANQEILETGSAQSTREHTDPRVQQFVRGQLEGPLVWG